MGRTRQDMPELTPRQREVLELLARGHTNVEIAEALGISANGAKWHVGELLTKFGVDSREDLAERWRSERSLRARATRWLGGLGGVPLGKGAAVFATAVVVTGAAVAAAIVLAMSGDDGPTPSSQQPAGTTPQPGATTATATLPTTPTIPAPTVLPALSQPELREVGEGTGLKMWMAPGADLTPTIGVLDGDLGGNILLVDPADGLVLGKVEVGYGPWGVFRRSAGELLIAHQPLGPPAADGGRRSIGDTTLAVLDLATLNVKREIPLPQRSFFTTYWIGMKLTGDERYLFYAAIYQPAAGCTTEDEARWAASTGHCDHHFIGTIDLTAASPSAALVELPLINCNTGPPNVIDGHKAYKVCLDGTTFVVDADNPTVITKVSEGTSRPYETDPVLNRNLASVISVVREPGGASGLLFSSGQFLLRPTSGQERTVSTLPNGKSPGFNPPLVLGDRIYLPYRDRYYDVTMSGIAVFDWQRGVMERDVPFEPAISVNVVDERTVLILLEDGSLQRIDLQSGNRTTLGGRVPLPRTQADFLP